MERMSEHTGLISSYQLLITTAQTNTGGKMYLDIAKSGYLFYGYSGGVLYHRFYDRHPLL